MYGMSADEFWFGEIELLKAYKKAYIRNTSYTAWWQGNYMFEAISKAIYNGFGRTKKTDEPKQYDIWKDPIQQLELSKENSEEKFRRQQYEQNAWLSRGLK